MSELKKEQVLVVCPGRGTYNATELGYLEKYTETQQEFLEGIEQYRSEQSQASLLALDRTDSFKSSMHLPGYNASALIYACALCDFKSINLEHYEICAVTGNSMGWYLALACAGALNPENAIHLINSMGTQMHDKAEGGQVLYPMVDENWCADNDARDLCDRVLQDAAHIEHVSVSVSIEVGGMRVFSANAKGVEYLKSALPSRQNRYPIVLPYHGAFHSELMTEISIKAKQDLPASLFDRPTVPLVDGRGHIWQPYSTDTSALHEYTLGHQVVSTYDFTSSIMVALKEFAPDRVIVLGPGTTLGPPIAQSLIMMNWLGLHSKQDFHKMQKENPFVLSMAIEEQEELVLNRLVQRV